jgi:glycosyltransferase involved in cell wall biosynthesis
MKISVVIPAYNEEKILGKCLEALKRQTKKPYEIIVVDNNSSDKTSEVAKNKGARVVFEKMRGASYARNKGFDEAKGDVVLRTDADTIVPQDWVEKMEKGFMDQDVAIVCGGVIYYKKFLNPLSHFLIFWINDIFGYKAITGPNFGIRKSVWGKLKDKVHNDNNAFHEDLDLAIHAIEYGKNKRDYSLMVASSPRKFSDLNTFLIKYPIKSLNTLFDKEHRKLSRNPILRAF